MKTTGTILKRIALGLLICLLVYDLGLWAMAGVLYGSDPGAETAIPCTDGSYTVTLDHSLTVWKAPSTNQRYMGESYEYRAAYYPENSTLQITPENGFDNRACYRWDNRYPQFRRTWVAVVPWQSDSGSIYTVVEENYGFLPLTDLTRLYRDYIRQNGLEEAFLRETGSPIGLFSSVDAVLADRWGNFVRGTEPLRLWPVPFLPKRVGLQLIIWGVLILLLVGDLVGLGAWTLHRYNEALRQKAKENTADWERKFRQTDTP